MKKGMEGAPLFFAKKKGEPRESGDMIVTQLGGIFMLMFVFAMLFVYIGYSKSVQMRLAIDNVGKEYLYQMEQEGTLTSEMKAAMVEDLRSLGVIYENEASISFDGTSHLYTQAAYGEKVTLSFRVSFDNPLYAIFSRENRGEHVMFTVMGLSPTITYQVRMSSTAKW